MSGDFPICNKSFSLPSSGFPDSVPQAATRENCLRNNAWARAIAAGEPRPR